MSSLTHNAVALGIDIGTSGARAAAIDSSGNTVAFAAAPFGSQLEQREPASWWSRAKQAIGDVAHQIDLNSIEGIAVDGTSGTVLALDKNDVPTGDVLMYNDPCPDAAVVARISDCAPAGTTAVGANSGLARAIYLASLPNAEAIVHQADWILMKLGCLGRVSDENNALKTGFDLGSETWPAWLEAAGMDISKLPTVRRAGAKVSPIAGHLLELGVPRSAWFHAGTTDGCASFLATGASDIGDAVTALGSTIVLKLASDTPINAPEYGVYSHRVGSFWLVGGASNSGGNVVRALIGDDRLNELTEMVDPHRPLGLDFYPLVRPGERFPINDPAYLPRLTPRPADDASFFQAILEGMTEIERLGYQRLRELGSPELRSLRTVGGGARNPAWATMRSNAMRVRTEPARSVEAAVGTAALVLTRLDNHHA